MKCIYFTLGKGLKPEWGTPPPADQACRVFIPEDCTVLELKRRIAAKTGGYLLPCMQRLRYFGHPEELQDYLDEGGACGSSHRSTEAVLNVVNSNFLELDLLVEDDYLKSIDLDEALEAYRAWEAATAAAGGATHDGELRPEHPGMPQQQAQQQQQQQQDAPASESNEEQHWQGQPDQNEEVLGGAGELPHIAHGVPQAGYEGVGQQQPHPYGGGHEEQGRQPAQPEQGRQGRAPAQVGLELVLVPARHAGQKRVAQEPVGGEQGQQQQKRQQHVPEARKEARVPQPAQAGERTGNLGAAAVPGPDADVPKVGNSAWLKEEIERFVIGMEKYGTCWARVQPVVATRTQIDCKDKWRGLVKIMNVKWRGARGMTATLPEGLKARLEDLLKKHGV